MVRPRTLSSVASRAVRNSTGTRCPRSASRWVTVKPSRSGSITSSTTRSGGFARTASSACCPVGGGVDGEPLVPQRHAHQLGDGRLVVDDQDAQCLGLAHAAILAGVPVRMLGVPWEEPWEEVYALASSTERGRVLAGENRCGGQRPRAPRQRSLAARGMPMPPGGRAAGVTPYVAALALLALACLGGARAVPGRPRGWPSGADPLVVPAVRRPAASPSSWRRAGSTPAGTPRPSSSSPSTWRCCSCTPGRWSWPTWG